MAPVELARGPLRLVLRPDVGGSIAGLWREGTAVLRACDPGALASPLDAACYPLVPYSNRLGFRRFEWLGRAYTTAPNFGASPHSLHGVGWQRPWRIVSQGADEVALALAHAGDADWPFAFEAEQRFALGERGLRIDAGFTNTAAVAAPVGLGWHPFFPRRARSHLRADVTHRWQNDASGLPARSVPQSGIDARVSDLHYDDCFDGWNGAARIDDELLSIAIVAPWTRLVVYTPGHEDWYCVEPVSHVNDALNMPDPASRGMRVLEPGETERAWMRLEIAPR